MIFPLWRHVIGKAKPLIRIIQKDHLRSFLSPESLHQLLARFSLCLLVPECLVHLVSFQPLKHGLCRTSFRSYSIAYFSNPNL
jgi:hypothetical protein